MSEQRSYERFFWFDAQVRARRFPNASGFARHFEVSVKTAQRAIDFMRDRLKCPLVYDEHRKGYFYDNPNFALPGTIVSATDLLSLLVARKYLKDIAQNNLSDSIGTLLLQMDALVSRNLHSGNLDDVISFEQQTFVPVAEQVFHSVLGACLSRTVISFQYYSPRADRQTVRKVEPYHLINQRGSWYLVAFCLIRDDLRVFHLARMSGLNCGEKYFVPRSGIDIQSFIAQSFGVFKGEDTQQVRLRFSPFKARWIREQVWHRHQRFEAQPDGALDLFLPVAGFTEIQMEVLRHGVDVEVLEPAEFRAGIKKVIDGMQRKYSGNGKERKHRTCSGGGCRLP